MAKGRFAHPERRPINRYLGACEGLQEKLYFAYLKQLIRGIANRSHDVEFDIINTHGGSPLVVAKRAYGAATGRNTRVAAFDYDGKTADFAEALDYCRKNGIVTGYSNYCFDLWLLLHKRMHLRTITSLADYEDIIRVAYGLRADANIKEQATIAILLASITLDDVRAAITHAKGICVNNSANRQLQRTPGAMEFYENPDLSIHVFVERVLREAGLAT